MSLRCYTTTIDWGPHKKEYETMKLSGSTKLVLPKQKKTNTTPHYTIYDTADAMVDPPKANLQHIYHRSTRITKKDAEKTNATDAEKDQSLPVRQPMQLDSETQECH